MHNDDLMPGDVFLTRNKEGGGWGNETPGHWNHAAIYIGDDAIIEAQAGAINAVVMFTVESFRERYPEYTILRPIDPDMGMQAAEEAHSMLGSKYRKMASIFYHLRDTEEGENCLSVVRKAYRKPMGFDPIWRIPDHIKVDGMFYELYYLKNSEWTTPGKWLDGKIK